MYNAIRKVISKLSFKNYLHYKFLVQTIEVLVSDKDEYLNNRGDIYNFLGTRLYKDPETVKTKLKTINNNFDKGQYQLLGFKKKPKNTELLDRLLELTKQENQRDKVEITDEHKE